jgi:DNA-binding transcriptional LysR family regulator
MDTVQGIKVFVAAVQTGSFSGAGQRLGISAKLASKYMAELETRLGAQLLQRTTRRLGLTSAGERLMARAPDWLDELDEMTGALRETGISGTLRVASSVAFGELHMMPLLQRFRRPHPDLQVDLRLSDRFVDLAAEGIDLAIRIGRLDSSALIARKLGQVRLVLVAAPSYLAARGAPVQLDDLAAHACIRDTNLRDGAWSLTEGDTVRRIAVSGAYAVNSPRAARDLAVMGEGIALSPDYMVRADLAEGRLAQVLCASAGPALDIHAVHLAQRKLARRTRALLDFLARDRFDGYLG